MFYKKNINISHPKEIYNFILNHFTYCMNNSGSGKLTIANNVKIYNLDLKCDKEKALDIAFNDIEYADAANELIDAFIIRHNSDYSIYFNGRSYGYICLVKQDSYSSSDSSILPDYIYNRYDYNTFKSKYYINREYEDVLRPLYEVIRDFDKLCDELQRILEERVLEEEAKEEKYLISQV